MALCLLPNHANRRHQHRQRRHHESGTRTWNQEAAPSQPTAMDLGSFVLLLSLRILRARVDPFHETDEVCNLQPRPMETKWCNLSLFFPSSPSFWLGRIMITWGIFVCCMAAVQSYGALVALRACQCIWPHSYLCF